MWNNIVALLQRTTATTFVEPLEPETMTPVPAVNCSNNSNYRFVGFAIA
ncbi:MAG: hypothetical protein HON76_12950 [Candidatus Scalindua sp.]|nr:hypothetical protein [Candidatus Scalindua sp.]MBT5307669.1 hypothetical protein [Candidatus Scalindua sp.]MBT6045864.1 hypothetical protein [Candidatus Scalindua sp.]MBT6230452.1 hypothetical protein [Candidatus Scalindua sp.]MBT6563422.1 hypothetical protein [Candidatus Scalindua sp.]